MDFAHDLAYTSIVILLFVCLVAHALEFYRRTTSVFVKLLLPPRQSLGNSNFFLDRLDLLAALHQFAN